MRLLQYIVRVALHEKLEASLVFCGCSHGAVDACVKAVKGIVLHTATIVMFYGCCSTERRCFRMTSLKQVGCRPFIFV